MGRTLSSRCGHNPAAPQSVALPKKSAAERVSRALKLEELIQFSLLSSQLAPLLKAAVMPQRLTPQKNYGNGN